MKIRKAELIELVERAMNKEEKFVDDTQLDTNPQVIEMCNKARGKRSAFYDVLDALRGNAIFLRIDAGKP
uniref:Uncharacterized protein n=1 Tax=viral metagenome TaxID=1070528 RepID=A0A6H2A549_9ZZZZ